MRILYVAMANSIHVARFLRQVDHLGWDLHLFNSHPDMGPGHPMLRNVTLHGCRFWQAPPDTDASVRKLGFWPFRNGSFLANKVGRYFLRIQERAARKLASLIKKLRPDVIHSHEIQHGGYLMTQARRYLDGNLPPWIVTNWGNDIFFFGKLKEHEPQIRKVLSACAYYTCETERDLRLAAEFGFRGEYLLPVMPNPGGFHFDNIASLRQPGLTSKRRLILLKGYQNIFGRALVGLYALALCQDVLRDYKIVIINAADEVAAAAEILARSTNLQIEVMPHTNCYDDMLRLRGQARVSIGLSVSDAASISFLEALAMGSFPIQSDRGGSHEWIRDGEGGFIVHPEDPHMVAAALRRALKEDELVDRAAEMNLQVARERMDFYRLREHVVNWYQGIVGARQPLLPSKTAA
jgi:glycosyltransferase involved in cell wall biosynthesis